MIILLFGAPGSGKGTQARLLSEWRGIPAISTGEILRAECRTGSQLGQRACTVLSGGGLLDDAAMNAMVEQRLRQDDCRGGFILDGYPRTVSQADFLRFLMQNAGLAELEIVHLDVPDAVLIARLSSRRYCPKCERTYQPLREKRERWARCDRDGEVLMQRSDDAPDVVARRLQAYHELTEPVIQYYQGARYHRIDGDGEPEQVFDRIGAVMQVSAQFDRPAGPVCAKASRVSDRYCSHADYLPVE